MTLPKAISGRSRVSHGLRALILGLAAVGVLGLVLPAAMAEPATPGAAFAGLPGRWVGEGRLGFKDGKMEAVTCRATYFATEGTSGLRQTIRCASPSGKIELKSNLDEKDGVLSGAWAEEMYNLAGQLSGSVTPAGLRVVVKGDNLDANMDVIVKGQRQIVEIQFHNTSLVGLTLILNRSDSTNGDLAGQP
jgi:hypothetical protein